MKHPFRSLALLVLLASLLASCVGAAPNAAGQAMTAEAAQTAQPRISGAGAEPSDTPETDLPTAAPEPTAAPAPTAAPPTSTPVNAPTAAPKPTAAPAPTPITLAETAAPASTPGAPKACGPGKGPIRVQPIRGEPLILIAATDQWITAHLWSNHWDPNTPERRVYLEPGDSIEVMSGGGSYWTYTCEREALAQDNGDPMLLLDTDKLRDYIDDAVIFWDEADPAKDAPGR